MSHARAFAQRLGLALALGLALSACGWRAGLSSDLPAGSTVAVAFLGNETRLPDLEVEVTRALTDALIDWVGLRPAHPGDADYVVRGSVFDYRRRAGVRSVDNEQLETGVEIGVWVELVRRADGAVLTRSERQLSAGFALDGRGLATDAPVERAERDRALTHLAQGLILDLFRPPAYKGVE